MSAEERPYNPLMIKAWTLLTVIIALGLLGMFILGDHLLNAGAIVWHLIRWIFSPII